jgi:cell division protein FtsQ
MTPSYAMPMPLDVRLMTLVTSVLGWAFVAAVLMAGGMWAVRHPVWSIKAIEVHGDLKHQNEVTFRAHMASKLRGSFLTLDLDEVKQVFESVPWVRAAVVERAFPNRIRVTLQEHQAVAWWGQDGGSRLVNRQGEVFEASAEDDETDVLPQLAGPDDQASRVKALFERLRPLFETVDTPVQRLELTAQGSWRAVLDNAANMELGRGEPADIEARVNRYLSTIGQVTQQHGRRVLSADLRYPTAYAVRMQGVTTVDPSAPKPPTAKPMPRPAPKPVTPAAAKPVAKPVGATTH